MTAKESDADPTADAVTADPEPSEQSGQVDEKPVKSKAKSATTPIPPAAKAKLAARKRAKQSPKSRTPVRIGSPRWIVPLMLTLFVIGLIWIVAYYVAPDAPVISTLGWWNVVVGFAFLAGGFIVATRWR